MQKTPDDNEHSRSAVPGLGCSEKRTLASLASGSKL